VAERISRFSPDARIIYLMRDPVERAISHYLFLTRSGRERRPPDRAFREDARYLDVSRYDRQIEPYLAFFGREKVYALTTEELRVEPRATMRALFDWLDIEPAFTPPELGRRHKVTGREVARLKLPYRTRRLLRSGAGLQLRRLGERLPVRAYALLRGSVETRDTVATPTVLEFLRRELAPAASHLSVMLGRRFDDWTTACPPA
jgi:hypothetical protein